MRDRGETPLIPANPADYLTRWLFDAGPTSAGSMGEGQLSYQDLYAWQEIHGVELMPWEAQTLRSLSLAYAVERQKAEQLDCPAPYAGERDDLIANRDIVARKVRTAFSNLKKKEG